MAKIKNAEELAAEEQLTLKKAELAVMDKHGDRIVEGSICRGCNLPNEADAQRWKDKLTVEIRTRGLDGEYDGLTRRVATSDVHQIFHQPEVAEVMRKTKAKEKRAAEKAILEAAGVRKAKAEPVSVTEAADTLGV